MIRRRVSLVILAVIAIVLGLAVAGTPDTGQSPQINDVNVTEDTDAPLIDTLPMQGLADVTVPTTAPAPTTTVAEPTS